MISGQQDEKQLCEERVQAAHLEVCEEGNEMSLTDPKKGSGVPPLRLPVGHGIKGQKEVPMLVTVSALSA